MIAGYMGKGDVFDKLAAPRSKAYPDEGELDYPAFEKAIRQAGSLLRRARAIGDGRTVISASVPIFFRLLHSSQVDQAPRNRLFMQDSKNRPAS